MDEDRDDLDAWIAELRDRLARGELDGRTPIEIAGLRLPSAGLAARIMLADLDHYDDLTPEQCRDVLVQAPRRMLLRDFRELRALLG
ncbi:MAG: hypothetical protein M3O34_09255 [Chloroflexota bacterium]|nr:hypothetical protein [Chloroflexota bacterium]